MKKSKLISMIFIFILLFGITGNVFAVSYGYKTCEVNGKRQRWSGTNPCLTTDTTTKIVNDALIIDYNSNINVDLKKIENMNFDFLSQLKKDDNIYYPVIIYGDAFVKLYNGFGQLFFEKLVLPMIGAMYPPAAYATAKATVERLSGTITNSITSGDELKIVEGWRKLFMEHFTLFDNQQFVTHDLTRIYDYYSSTKQIPDTIYVYVYINKTISPSLAAKKINDFANNIFHIDELSEKEMPAFVSMFWTLMGIEFRKYVYSVSELDYDASDAPEFFKADTMRIYSTNLGDNELNSCPDLENDISKLKNIAKSKGKDSQVFNDLSTELTNKCEQYKQQSEDVSAKKCLSLCMKLPSILENIGVNDYDETNECGLGPEMIGWLLRILKIIRYIVPIIVVVLSTTEYIGAITSADDEALKKVGGRFSKRLFIMILIFLLPSILQFLLGIFNIEGFDPSNPYCLK